MKEIILYRGEVALVDDEDYEYLSKMKWHSSKGYAISTQRDMTSGKQIKIKMHRLIMNPSKGLLVDHINGNRLDNRRENLRIVTSHQNAFNLSKVSRETTSQFKGVHFDKATGKWKGSIRFDGKLIHLGYFSDEKLCAIEYNHHAIKYFGEFAKLNDVDMNP